MKTHFFISSLHFNKLDRVFLLILLSIVFTSHVFSQNKLIGKVVDAEGTPLSGANVYLENTYDGATSDENGTFHFFTSETGKQQLTASMIGYLKSTVNLVVLKSDTILLVLKESLNTIDAVTITAGTFAASDDKRAAVLQPLDIYTTASANGDVMAAMRTMPGTQTATDDGRLLVRGGDASESKTYIDGLLTAQPYNNKTPDLATRGRFSPSLFNGVNFNSGGYSAEFGQALSSVLVLNSTDMETESFSAASMTSVGGEASYTKASKNYSASINGGYTNMYPSYKMLKSSLEWSKPFEGMNFSSMIRYKWSSTGMLKAFVNSDFGRVGYDSKEGDSPFSYKNKSRNNYVNLLFNDCFDERSCYRAGVSFSSDHQNTEFGNNHIVTLENTVDARFTVVSQISDAVLLTYGLADTYTHYEQVITGFTQSGEINIGYNDHISAGFSEAEIKFSKKLAIRPGVRMEYSSLLHKANFAPRFAMAYQTGKNSQVSASFGNFYQNPENSYLKYQNNLGFERATHYVASFQSGSVKNRLFRTELYHKKYANLITYEGANAYYPRNISNEGNGYATGLDIFWRDKKSIKNLDYWVTYSYVDTKRLYHNFPTKATPSFISNHNFSLVGKYWIHRIATQVGASFTMASARHFDDPSTPNFMDMKIQASSDLSLNLSHVFYLGSRYSVFYLSVTNVLGNDNLIGYRLATQPNSMGQMDVVPLNRTPKRFLFAGLFLNFG